MKARAQVELAIALIETAQSAEAIPLLQAVLSSEPRNQSAEFEVGTALARQERFTAPELHTLLGIICSHTSREAQAIVEFQRSVALNRKMQKPSFATERHSDRQDV